MLYATEDYFGSCQSIFAEHLKGNFQNPSALKYPISEVTRKKLHNEIQALGRQNGRKYCNSNKEAPRNSYLNNILNPYFINLYATMSLDINITCTRFMVAHLSFLIYALR